MTTHGRIESLNHSVSYPHRYRACRAAKKQQQGQPVARSTRANWAWMPYGFKKALITIRGTSPSPSLLGMLDGGQWMCSDPPFPSYSLSSTPSDTITCCYSLLLTINQDQPPRSSCAPDKYGKQSHKRVQNSWTFSYGGGFPPHTPLSMKTDKNVSILVHWGSSSWENEKGRSPRQQTTNN